jgi:phosphoesterase RecJ-like protein
LSADDRQPSAIRHETVEDIPAQAEAIRLLVTGHERVAILTHSNADADAAASALTMRAICTFLGRPPILTITGDTQVPENLMFLTDVLVLTSDDRALEAADLVIYVDCAEAGRIGPLYGAHEAFLKNHPATINIDHHVTNTRFASLNCVIPEAAATSEILMQMCQHLAMPVDASLATSLLAGIYGDTLGLRTPSTTPTTMRVSATLVEAGANIDMVVDWLFRVKPWPAVRLWAAALALADWSGPVIWTYIDRETLERTGSVPSQAEGLINFLAGTIGARAAALAYQETDGWRVSLRSVYDDVDVAELASTYGGGGHPRAAGLRLAGDQSALNEFIKGLGETIAQLPSSSNGTQN